MLEGELDALFGYEKHTKSPSQNAHNGHESKTIRTSFGEAQINVPRDRDSSFNPILIPKRKNMAEGVENVIISLYAKGINKADIEEQMREIYDFKVSLSAISRITDRVSEDIIDW